MGPLCRTIRVRRQNADVFDHSGWRIAFNSAEFAIPLAFALPNQSRGLGKFAVRVCLGEDWRNETRIYSQSTSAFSFSDPLKVTTLRAVTGAATAVFGLRPGFVENFRWRACGAAELWNENKNFFAP